MSRVLSFPIRRSSAARAHLAVIFVSALVLGVPAGGQVPADSYVNFEGAQTSPIRLSSDGLRLFAVNTPDARLSVFDLTNPSSPTLISEIPVGIEPVSVNPRTPDEAWVVNQESDSISIVSVPRGIVVDTLYVKDEPADVVFAGNLAFVTVSRRNEVRVYHAVSRALVKVIPLAGENPRAIEVNASRTKVYVAFALSGNRTTIVPLELAPAPPPPTNKDLPPPPETSLIVDAADPFWSRVLRYRIPDYDVVEIDARLLVATRYYPGAGTINLGVALRPDTGEIYVSNTDARNLTRFEPNLRGHWVDNRVTRIDPATGETTPFDLNAGIDYAVLPNDAARATALAQPAGLAFGANGRLYVAAYGTDRIGVLDPDGNVLTRIEIGPATGIQVDPRTKRGPRSLAVHPSAPWLYVLNRISNTISVVDIQANAVTREIPAGRFDPTPEVIRSGRGFLYDAKLSGNGTGACASCHVDAEMDLLAWDLGNPNGTMTTLIDPVNGLPLPLHPMKGPMTTQSLRGLKGLEPYHWRGDRENFAAFNPAFESLMGGTRLSAADMQAFTDFINTIVYQPNPNQNLDRTLPASIFGGDPEAGRFTFMNEPFRFDATCSSCHTVPGAGTNGRIQFFRSQVQPIKVAQLRNVYQKLGYSRAPGSTSRNGFGLDHDGVLSNLFDFLSQPQFNRFADDTTRKLNLAAFLVCFDTGTAPAVGYSQTLTGLNVDTNGSRAGWLLLVGQAAVGNIDLIAKGTVDGRVAGLLYRPSSNDYLLDRAGEEPLAAAALRAKLLDGDTLTLMGVPPGSGRRMGIDRDLNGTLDGDEPQ